MSNETHRIRVTSKDIFTANQGDAESCMVWKAIMRELQLDPEGPIQFSVGIEDIGITGPGGAIDLPLDPDIGAKIVDWDDRKSSVKPFEFDLNLPADWREQVAAAAGD